MIRTYNGKTPKIAPSAFVSEAAYIVGDVEIGERANIWPGAVIRGDYGSIRIGNNTSIQDNTVVHAGGPLVIGDNVLIGHSCVIHCQSIGHQVIVGVNATLLDDAEIGDQCIIGANAVVTPGMKIPSGSLVIGIPAKVKRKLSWEQLERVKEDTLLYADLGQEYKRQGF